MDRRPVFVARAEVRMVSSAVERATNNTLMAPDWALNMDICDMLNRHPGHVKDVVKSIKRRIGSKKPKVQLLNLTLLETIVKNCGDVVHMNVAQKGLPQEMVKIVKKKPEYEVKEKILSMLDTWQEEFGGPRARYHQYFAAYQELLRGGATFPQRSDSSSSSSSSSRGGGLSRPALSYARSTQPVSSSPLAAGAHLPTLSLSEIQKLRASVDVVSEMLTAIQPGNKEALRQEALVELVDQCQMTKPKVVHLVNSTVDESLLCQGLALNDELQRELSKYESLFLFAPTSSSSVVPLMENPEPESETEPEPIPDQQQHQVSVSAPTATPDLLSCDLLLGEGDEHSPLAHNSLALIPISCTAHQPTSPVATDQNALALADHFSTNPSSQFQHPYHHTEILQHEHYGFQQVPCFPHVAQGAQSPPPPSSPLSYHDVTYEQATAGYTTQVPWSAQQTSPLHYNPHHSKSTSYVPGSAYDHQSGYPPPLSGPSWATHTLQLQHQPSSPVNGAQNGGAMPPPPWESQSTEIQPFGTTLVSKKGGAAQSPRMQSLGVTTPGNEHQIVGMFVQPITGSQLMALNQSYHMPTVYTHPTQGSTSQMINMLPQAMPSTAQTINPLHMIGYGGQEPQYLEQGLYGLSLKDDASSNPSPISMASYLPPMKQQPKAGGDLLFGDLVDIVKLKPAKATPDANGGM